MAHGPQFKLRHESSGDGFSGGHGDCAGRSCTTTSASPASEAFSCGGCGCEDNGRVVIVGCGANATPAAIDSARVTGNRASGSTCLDDLENIGIDFKVGSGAFHVVHCHHAGRNRSSASPTPAGEGSAEQRCGDESDPCAASISIGSSDAIYVAVNARQASFNRALAVAGFIDRQEIIRSGKGSRYGFGGGHGYGAGRGGTRTSSTPTGESRAIERCRGEDNAGTAGIEFLAIVAAANSRRAAGDDSRSGAVAGHCQEVTGTESGSGGFSGVHGQDTSGIHATTNGCIAPTGKDETAIGSGGKSDLGSGNIGFFAKCATIDVCQVAAGDGTGSCTDFCHSKIVVYSWDIRTEPSKVNISAVSTLCAATHDCCDFYLVTRSQIITRKPLIEYLPI